MPHPAIATLVEDPRLFRYTDDTAIPEPNSCWACGAAGSHGMSWTPARGSHYYIAPSDAVRLLRMKARRDLKR